MQAVAIGVGLSSNRASYFDGLTRFGLVSAGRGAANHRAWWSSRRPLDLGRV